MKDKTKAYMAGLMDSEGCFGIYKEKHGHFTPHIIFTSSYLPLASWIVERFGGVCTQRPSPTKPYFHWQLNGIQKAPEFLRSMLPYLRVKQEQALLMLDFMSAKLAGNKIRQQELCDRVKALKSESRNDRTLDGAADDKLTHAYLAGVFDGEGSISLFCHKRPKGDLHYVKFVAVTNTDLSLLNFFQRLYGGTIRSKNQPNKQCYEWNLRRNECIGKFLNKLLPYLVIKKDRANIMMQFISLTRQGLNPAARYKLYSDMRALITTKNAKPMVQSELHGDVQSEPAIMQVS